MTFEHYESAMEYNCRRHQALDMQKFQEISNLLPKRQDGDCGYCGPHSYLSMRLALIVTAPRRILEIGFNLGHSALFWLDSSSAELVSIDIKDDERVRTAVDVCTTKFPSRFRFLVRGRNPLNDIGHFDLAFIDGSHGFEDVLFDIQWCKNIGIEYLLLDDWLTLYGEVQRAVLASGLKIVFVSGNQALVTTSNTYSHYYAA